MYNSEKEFLENYDSNQFEKLSMTTDIIIFSVSDKPQENYRKNDEKNMSILLVKREGYPYKNKWCLPGGFLDIKEELEECPKRILERETNIKDVYLEQLYTFGSINRDPRMRIVSTSYMALIDKNKLLNKLNENAKWFDVKIIEKEDDTIIFKLENQNEEIRFVAKRKLKEAMIDQYEYEIIENEKLAFDHALVILKGMERLRNKIQYTDIVFRMMPKYFTLGELQKVYEVILDKKLLDPAFRRIIADKVEKTDKLKKGEGHRPSALFTYKKNK